MNLYWIVRSGMNLEVGLSKELHPALIALEEGF
jgi:hypothetical protein